MNENLSIANLLETYCHRVNRAVSSVGKYAIGEYSPIERLQKGKMTYERAGRLVQYLSDNWPPDLEWPADIDRPAPTPAQPAFSGNGAGGAITPQTKGAA